MKTRFLLMALALPAVFAACTNEELGNDVLKNDGRELLSRDFSIIATKTNALESRGQWEQEIDGEKVSYEFNWINAVKADEIGLCWTGAATAADGSDVSVANPSNMALSNYQFVLSDYTYVTAGGADASYAYATAKAAEFANPETYNNYRTASFSVTGVTPLTGEYVMYYPYNDELKNVGYLPVSVEANQTIEDIDIEKQLAAFGNVTTCISKPYEFSSSESAADVQLHPYTTGLLLRMVKAESSDDANVKRIMLVAADGKNIINAQTLDLATSAKTSTGVTVMTLTLPDEDAVNEKFGQTVNDDEVPVEALMAILPQTLKLGDFELLFVNADSKAYSYPLTGNLTLSAGTLRAPTVTLDAAKFTMDIISDAKALTAAINGATSAAKTVSTYKNVPVEFATAATFNNTKKVTVNAEKITFKGNVTFNGDIEFSCPVEFKGAVTVGEGVTVTLADGTVFETTSSLVMAAKNGTKVSTLNLNATNIKAALDVDIVGATVNFVGGTSTLNGVQTIGENFAMNVKSGATVNVNVENGLTNEGTVNVEQGGTLEVAAVYTLEDETVVTPSIVNSANIYVNGALTNNSLIENEGLLQTDGAGVINNNKTIVNTGNIVMMQSEGVALNQVTGATVEDKGNISGISRISGGDVVITVDNTKTLEKALENPAYTNHTAFRITTEQTVTKLVNTTKKLILEASLILNATSDTADNATGAIEVVNNATVTSTDKLNVTGDVTIASGKTLTVDEGTYVKVSGKIYNNGNFVITNNANSFVFCNGIVTGTGATWAPTPQW